MDRLLAIIEFIAENEIVDEVWYLPGANELNTFLSAIVPLLSLLNQAPVSLSVRYIFLNILYGVN